MANIRQKPLTDKEAKSASSSIAVGGVPGLTLRVRKSGASVSKTFVLRYQSNGSTKWFTIGAYGIYTLAQAREIAKDWLIKIKAGTDPKAEIRAKAAEAERPQYDLTVEQLLREFIAFEESRGRWSTRGRQTHAEKADGWIRNHMSAKLRSTLAIELTADQLADEYRDKWLTMRSTPEKCIGEIKRAFDWAVALKKLPNLVNPADIRGALGHLLPAAKMRPRLSHMPHLPPERMPEFFADISGRSGVTSRALLFAILTCSRIDNCLSLRWSQVDLDNLVITIPREEMKVKGLSFDRQTPLSPQAAEILKSMPRFPVRDGEPDFVWRSFTDRKNGHLSDTSLRNLIRRASFEHSHAGDPGYTDPVEVDAKGMPRIATPHGLARASFETWANNPKQFKHAPFDKDIVEACLDHFSPKYGGAYMRAYPLEDMREILDQWAAYCFSSCSSS